MMVVTVNPEGEATASVGDAVSVLERNGRSFRFAGRLLDRTMLERCARLYRFCRYVDDLGDDEQILDREETLSCLEHDLLSGESTQPYVMDFLALAKECSFDVSPGVALIQGVKSDLGEVRFRSERDLDRYAYRVAGTVGVLMCGVFGVSDREAFYHAIDLGMAMQFTNIARDVGEDARLKRRYLPEDYFTDEVPLLTELAGDNLTEHSSREVKTAVQRLLGRAQRYYASGIAGLGYLPLRVRLGIFMAATIYREIGNEISRKGYAVSEHRAVVSLPRKLLVASRTVGGFCVDGGISSKPMEHAAKLHRHLRGLPHVNVPEGEV